MKNQKYTLVLVVLLVLLGIGYYLSRGSSSLLADREFAVADTARVERIVLTREMAKMPKPERVELVRKKNGWWANDLYAAPTARMKQVLETIAQIQAREPVDVPARANALRYIKEAHVKVEVFWGDSSRVYYVGPGSPDRRGSLAYLERDDIPYIVEIPGFHGSVDRYFATNIKDWRDLRIFSGTHETLRKVEMQYRNAEDSWTMTRNADGMWHLQGTPTDTSASLRYMRQYKDTYALEPADDRYPGRFDAVRKQQPDIRLTLTDKAGKTTRLNMMILPQKPDLMVGWVEGKEELLLLQTYALEPYLVSRKELMPKR